MAYETPSVATFRIRFPELDAAADPVVSFAIDDATGFVSEDWTAVDYPLAILFLAAHFVKVALNKVEGGATAEVGMLQELGLGSDVYLRAASFGNRSLSFGHKTANMRGGGKTSQTVWDAFLMTTEYGQRYIALRQRNVIPVLIV